MFWWHVSSGFGDVNFRFAALRLLVWLVRSLSASIQREENLIRGLECEVSLSVLSGADRPIWNVWLARGRGYRSETCGMEKDAGLESTTYLFHAAILSVQCRVSVVDGGVAK